MNSLVRLLTSHYVRHRAEEGAAMTVARTYRGTDLDGDFLPVRDFLRRIGQPVASPPIFGWVRWEWAFALPHLDRTSLDRMGVWEDDGRILGVTAFEDGLGDAYLLVDPARRDVLPAMLDHALDRLRGERGVRILVGEDDPQLQRLARERGLVATQAGDEVAVLDLDGGLTYTVPPGYKVVGLDEGVDLVQLDRVLHRGFGHPGDPHPTPEDLAWRERSVSAPSGDRALSIAVVADDGTYVAYCGTWFHPGDHAAVVEPVCTDPDHRRRGLGRAAVLEAVRRCAERGAERAQVGSRQQFYYALGFAPRRTATWWAAPDHA
jgi:ribosomal protein S18 acetylase RimI-like enzyme